MIGIKKITYCVADELIDSNDLVKKFNVNQEFVKEKTGFTSLYKLNDNQDILDLIKKNINLLKSISDIDFAKIDLIVCITQNTANIRMPHIAAFVQDLICPNRPLPSFDINLGCSGWVYGIEIVKSFMESNGIENALLVTCDSYSKIIDPEDKNTSLLFSDGSSITWLSQEHDVQWIIGKGVYGTDGGKYQTIYRNQNEKLHMNGRFLFETVVKTIPIIIKNTIEKNELCLGDVNKYVIHQASKYLVEYLADNMNLKEKMQFAASDIGNVVSSSIPSVFDKVISDTDKTICVCGFGVGFSWASNILRRKCSG